MKTLSLSPATCGLLLAGALLGVAAPAAAQTEEDIIVTGNWGRVPNNVDSLSQRVSYRDLDLSLRDDWRELRHRVSLTARYLCDRLGEPDSASSSFTPSCRDAATRDAMRRVGTVRQDFAPRGTAWIAPARWEAPYPADWESTYPEDESPAYP
ncbi:MAG: UrcA family protein [Sphingomonas sp.]|jgi:UrcA family protein|uniref:UrcA family protein n=1 Tax=Sphingomonas sp. TaxID=28214 RepID=UPI003567BDC0